MPWTATKKADRILNSSCIMGLAALQQVPLRRSKGTPYFACHSGLLPEERTKTHVVTDYPLIIRLFQIWKRYGHAVQELSQLSDRELADIGITRGDIARIAWDQSDR